MRQAFQAFLALFGVIVIAISLAHMAIGPRAIIGAVAVNPTMAGEDRFFAGLFLCTGIALLWCSRGVHRKRIYVNLLAAVFFVGGIGRSPASRGPTLGSCSTARQMGSTSRCSPSSWRYRP
jgi:Domain of unknown function (DUF4345)